MKQILMLTLGLSLSFAKLSAQCDPATGMSGIYTTSAACQGTGAITVTTVTPAATGSDYYDYELRTTAGVVVKPWQNSNQFTQVASGSYRVAVRKVCVTSSTVSYSNEYVHTANTNVGSTYVAANISNMVVSQLSQCNNGKLTISGTGTAPREFALVGSLNEPNNTSTVYVRPRQSSNIFESLAPGTYYVRLFDACEGYDTKQVIVQPFTLTTNLGGTQLIRKSCDGFVLTQTMANENNTSGSVWVEWPNGAITPAQTTSNATSSYDFNFSYAEMQTGYNTSASFPNNITTWPLTFKVHSTDACGNNYVKNVTVNNPDAININFITDNVSANSNCLAQSYVFTATHTGTSFNTAQYSLINNLVKYSLDGGSTWLHATSSSTHQGQSNNILLTRGVTHNVKINYCGQIFDRTITPAAFSDLNATVIETNLGSCFGKSGISMAIFGSNATAFTVTMTSAPAGQAIVPPFTINNPNNASQTMAPELSNLLPGAYSFEISDNVGNGSCPVRTISKNITITHPLAPIEYSFVYNCSNQLVVTSTNTFFNGTTEPYLGASLKMQIINPNGTVNGSITTGSNSSTGTTITRNVSSLTDGTYTIRVFINGATNNNPTPNTGCTVVEKTFVKGSTTLDLSQSMFMGNCNGSPNSATLMGNASGGFPNYSWTLYENTYGGTVVGTAAQTSNIYNGLNANQVYVLEATDQCGRGGNISLSISNTTTPVATTLSGNPCPGNLVTIAITDIQNVTYQWYRNNTLIPGATSSNYIISNVSAATEGDYKVEATAGSCLLTSSISTVDMDDCRPVPVALMNFDAVAKQQNVLLSWSTVMEKNSKGFAVERSTDAANWTSLGFVPSKSNDGSSKAILDYNFIDASLSNNTYYYRLLHTDFDGTLSLSDVVKVNINQEQSLVDIYPNPAVSSNLNIVSQNANIVAIKVINPLGAVTYDQKANTKHSTISIAEWSSGVYFIQVSLADGTQTSARVVKP